MPFPYTQIDGRWIQRLDEKFRRYPYNLRCLLDAIKRGEIIFFPEGEQKTQRLIDAGVNATCIAGGAKAWPKYRYDYMHYFQGAHVVLLPDHDESGYKFVETVHADLKTVCKDVVIVPLPGLKEPKEDIVEWLDKYGHTVEELAELAHAAFERASGRKRVVSETALDLWHAKLEPREDLIEEFVTEGTHLIASKKGVGKTHLLFNIAVSVATGAYALSKFPTVQSGVLCYFLDDPRSRIKLRLHDMLADTIGADSDPDPSLANLTIKYEVPSPRSAKAFLDDVQAHLDAHPNTKLIIVDMLGRIKPPARGNANLYQDDNDFMTEVRQFMAERRLTCLISHHVRKASADDIYETINGTTGLIGAVDGVFILESQRGSNTAILHAMGNDIEEREIGLKFDPARMSWDVADVSDVKTPARGPLDSAQSPCREWLKKILSTGAMTPDEVKKQGKANGFSRSTVYRAIKKWIYEHSTKKRKADLSPTGLCRLMMSSLPIRNLKYLE